MNSQENSENFTYNQQNVWNKLFDLSTKVKYLKKQEKFQFLYNILFFIAFVLTIGSQVYFYDLQKQRIEWHFEECPQGVLPASGGRNL